MKEILCVAFSFAFVATESFALEYKGTGEKKQDSVKSSWPVPIRKDKAVFDTGVQDNWTDADRYWTFDGKEHNRISDCAVTTKKDNRGDDIVICKTPDAAIAATAAKFGGGKNEKADCNYELTGENNQRFYYRNKFQEGDVDSISIQCPLIDNALGSNARWNGSTRHSHPADGERHQWFSNADILSAISTGEIDYVKDDTMGIQLAFDPKDGSVYYIDNVGKRVKLKIVERDDGRVVVSHPDGTVLLDWNMKKMSEDGKYDSHAGYRPSELEKLRKLVRGASVGRANPMGSESLNSAGVNKGDPSGGIGIRGWCKCGGKKDEGCCCGYGAILGSSAADCPYVYVLCRRCGKCMRDSDDLIDVKVEEALQKAKHMTTSQVVAERKKSQDRLLAIPDGQIVFPGKCVCEKPDAIKAGGLDGKEFHVCLFCGRYYVPVNNTVSIGPTARKEMGLK